MATRSVPLPLLPDSHLLISGLLLALGFGSIAAPAGAAESVPLVRFTVFSSRPLSDVAYVPRANAPVQTLKFASTARSQRYEYRGAMPLRFIDPEMRVIVAEARIPPEIRQPLLLFLPLDPLRADGEKLRYQVAVLDDSAARHAIGGLVIINFSGLELGGSVNNRPVTLQAGLNPTIAVGHSAAIRLTAVAKQRAYQAYAGTVKLAAKERALLVLFPPVYKGSLEVQARLLVDQPAAGAAPRK